MNKEMSWVPVFDEDKDNYVPGQYETKDIYQGENCLPQFDTKEECEQWCQNDSPFAPLTKSLDMNKKFVDNTTDTDLNNLMKEFDNYEVKESFENKSLKWWMSLSMDQQVTIGFKYDEPTFNLTIRAIMFEYEQSLKNK
jgi:hypothetical protein